MRHILNISTEKADSAFLPNAEEMDVNLIYMKLMLKVFQSKEQAKLTKSNLHAGRCPVGSSCGIPQSLCCLLI